MGKMTLSSGNPDALERKIPESQRKIFSPRQTNSRAVLALVGNVRSGNQMIRPDTPMKNGRNSGIPPAGKYLLSPASKVKPPQPGPKTETTVKERRRPSSHGCVTLYDFRSQNKPSPKISKNLPRKELVLNSHQQQCHVTRWNSWLSETPKWILRMSKESLDEKEKNDLAQIQVSKASHPHETASTNSSYTTIEEEVVLETSSRTEPENIIKKTLSWKDWSIQLSEDCKLLITGKIEETGVRSRSDVSSCELVDANTLSFNTTVHKLIGMPDHFTNLPCYVRNKFQCGFPDDWKTVKEKWVNYVKDGSPFDFNWSTGMNDSVVFVANSLKDTSHPLNTTYEKGNPSDVTKHNIEEALAPPSKKPDNNFKAPLPVLTSKKTVNGSRIPKVPLKRPYSPIMGDQYKRSCSGENKENENLPSTPKVQVKIEQLDSSNVSRSSVPIPVNTSTPTTPDTGRSANSELLTSSRKDAPNENQEIILLNNWIPVLVNDCDIKIRGFTQRGAVHESDTILARKSFDNFRCKSGINYKLVGPFADPDKVIPTVIQKKLAKGLPGQWKMMVRTWASLVAKKC